MELVQVRLNFIVNSVKNTIRQYLIERHPHIYCYIVQFKGLISFPARHSFNNLKKHIEHLLGNKEDVFFIQIGSNEGAYNDPLYHLIINHVNWHGIFVEPVKRYFEQLQHNYNFSPRFIFENVAIYYEAGLHHFHYVSDEAQTAFRGSLPKWYTGLGSFDRNHIMKHLNGILNDYIISEACQCVTLDTIMNKHNVQDIDILHIDTEGFDYNVLSQIDFIKHKPYLILYENKHLQAEEKHAAEKLLEDRGYLLTHYGEDTLAVLGG